MQAAGRQEQADNQERHAESQVQTGAERSLRLDRVCLQDEDVEESDRQTRSDATKQKRQEHQARTPVIDQQQVDREQLRVECCEER